MATPVVCAVVKAAVKATMVRAAVGAAVGAGITVVVMPGVLSAVGFTGAGIAAKSLAAKFMSYVALANGGGVPAGSLVALGQSLGAAGIPTAVKVAVSAAGAAIGSLL